MAQFSRPDRDITLGTWFPTPLYGQISESVRDDTSYISCGVSSNSICDIGLSQPNTPQAGTKTLRYAYAKSAAAGNDRNLIVRFKKGATVLHTFTHNLITEVWTQQAQSITGAIAGAEWATISVEFESTGTTGGQQTGRRDVYVSWAELEVPNAVIPTTVGGSFTANAMIERVYSGSFTMNAQINAVPGPIWATPSDRELLTDMTPVMEFTIPALGGGAVSFELEIDRTTSFNTGNFRLYDSSVSATGWEYYNGTGWVPMLTSGVPNTYVGNLARFTLPVPLERGTWYRRIRAK